VGCECELFLYGVCVKEREVWCGIGFWEGSDCEVVFKFESCI